MVSSVLDVFKYLWLQMQRRMHGLSESHKKAYANLVRKHEVNLLGAKFSSYYVVFEGRTLNFASVFCAAEGFEGCAGTSKEEAVGSKSTKSRT